MTNIVKPCHRNRTPWRVTVQYRHVPYCPPQIHITEHYGRGVPNNHITGMTRYGENGEQGAERIAQQWRDADNGIDPAAIVVLSQEVTI